MVNPLQFSMVPQSIQTGNAPIILTGGPQASPGGISLGGNALMPTAVNNGSQLLSVVSGLEQILGSVGSLLQGLKGGLQGGVQNGMMQGIGISGGFNGLPGMGIAGGFNGLSGIGSAGGLGGIPTIGTAGSLAGIPGVGTAGSIGGIGSLMGGLSGSGPLAGLPGTINGMPVAGALGANIAFPGMLGASGIGSFPGASGIGGGFGSPVGLPQGSIILSGGPGIPGQVQGIPGQIQGIPGQVQGVPGQAQGANGLPSIPKVDPNDFVDFLLAGSQGGQTGTNELIEGRFARPGSKFATAGNNEFQALTAYAYANQFKAFALGKDAVFQPGKDINQLASNLNQAQNTQLAPEAETLANVAALYRGNLTGVNKYDNAKLQQLVASWGRADLAQTPGAGVSDVESIGIAVKAINEQPDPQIRQAWLQQIFDFQNNSPSSPSGAVPNVRQYQDAINLYRGGG
ncbi:MAG: hypothetical protein K2X66_15735, partial [Cyanobacteria bacterium]|nr:hypothetical protein [Cyanobacteriota bacterium]